MVQMTEEMMTIQITKELANLLDSVREAEDKICSKRSYTEVIYDYINNSIYAREDLDGFIPE